jgi:hypothetical protein
MGEGEKRKALPPWKRGISRKTCYKFMFLPTKGIKGEG